MRGKLHITDASGASWTHELLPDAGCTIGRMRGNDVVLNDRRVSRKHAFIAPEGTAFKLIDGFLEGGAIIRSVNHIFVNGEMQLERILQDGDSITIGQSTLKFEAIAEKPVTLRSIETLKPAAETGPLNKKTVNFEDAPLGHTQMQISVNEILGATNVSLESALVTPGEIKTLRRKAKVLELLYEMSKTLGTVFDIEKVFEKATDLIFRGTPADRVVALLIDDTADGEGHSLHQVAAKMRDATSSVLTAKLGVSRTITEKVINARVALLSQDVSADESLQGAASIVSQGVRSTICAPLITQSGVHGVIYADRLDPFAAFTEEHLALISAVAAQAAVTVETVKAHERLAREEVARANYSRFMPEYVVKQLLEDPDSFRLGGVNQTITVLFADIRGFTSLSETEQPEKIVALLNRYFSVISEIIFGNGGTLDKYIGDGIMALFGAPTASPNDARNAVKAAVEMQRKVAELNPQLKADGFAEIAIGVGLHTGVATVGYIGSELRSEYTAIGDTVNLSARLESNTTGGQILISDATAAAAGDIFPLVRRDPLAVKNRQQPVDVFEVVWNA
ncbi:MAG: FHA domain-containing protein [Acidobacteriota bacterium]|nr:MAG: FHA domain-containing protein [Acidobacteriota bacterium]